MLKRLKALYALLTTFFILILPGWVGAGGEGLDMPEALDRKVPLEGLTGIKLFFAKMYNENLLMYALVCTVLMAAVGVIIAYVTDIILKMMGMETSKIEHKE